MRGPSTLCERKLALGPQAVTSCPSGAVDCEDHGSAAFEPSDLGALPGDGSFLSRPREILRVALMRTGHVLGLALATAVLVPRTASAVAQRPGTPSEQPELPPVKDEGPAPIRPPEPPPTEQTIEPDRAGAPHAGQTPTASGEVEEPEVLATDQAANEATTDELMGDLLSGSSEQDDLAWLYSDESYEESTLAGTPMPAPVLPERGEGTPRRWDPTWARFGVGNYVFTAAALAVAVGSSLIPNAPERWRSRNDVDEWVRRRIGITDYDRSVWARDVSDVGVSLAVAYPFLVTSLIGTYWYRSSKDVAVQMALISAESLSVAMAVQGLTAGLSSRQRPYVRNCGVTLSENLDDCEGRKPYRSFFSGHATMSFTAAGVSCTHHMWHDVFGNSTADELACGAAIATAATVGAMRIVGDQHYLTDVAVGATFGTLAGVGIPWLLHYGPLAPTPDALGENQVAAWSFVVVPNGLGIGGRF